jgi:hypothetical protein
MASAWGLGVLNITDAFLMLENPLGGKKKKKHHPKCGTQAIYAALKYTAFSGYFQFLKNYFNN